MPITYLRIGKTRPRRVRPEQQIHAATVQHLGLRAKPGVVFLHPPNGGARRPVEAKILQSLGVKPGAPDLLLWHAGKSFALELKCATGKLSPAQRDMLTRLEAAGVATAVCYNIDSALIVLEQWGLIKPASSWGRP
jgi:hypothetical protein